MTVHNLSGHHALYIALIGAQNELGFYPRCTKNISK